MIAGAEHYFFCMPCNAFVDLGSYEYIQRNIRDHRRKHLKELKGWAGTVTILYDARKDPEVWLKELQIWAENKQKTESPKENL